MGQACCKEGNTGEISDKAAMAMQAQALTEAGGPQMPPVTETAKPTIVTDAATTAKVLTITVERTNKDTKWGLVWCENDSEPNTLRVKNIRPGQAFAAYNDAAGADVQIEPGDRIISVNAVPGANAATNPQEGFSMMRSELQKSTSVEIKVVKYAATFQVTFQREEGASLGLELHADDSPLVSRIVLDGAVDVQNQTLRGNGQLEQVVHEGMVVKAINGNQDVKEFRKLIAAETKVELDMQRFDKAFQLT
jgi:hypothetical protein